MGIIKKDLKKLSPYLWEIPKTFRSDMRVSGRIFASSKMIDDILADRSLDQLINATTIPGVIGSVLAMPDVHEGYGLPVGGVMATKVSSGIISPGAIGYDINCGVRLLVSEVDYDEIKDKISELINAFFAKIPLGVGRGGQIRLSDQEMDEVLRYGAKWAAKKGYIPKEDLEYIEEQGMAAGADPDFVSDRAKARGRDQLGTLGSGNHFLELQRVDQIFNTEVAGIFGLRENQITILLHSGSRGLGHQVCTDYVNLALQAGQKYKIDLPDRELAAVPLNSPEGQKYLGAQRAALNYAWANRSLLSSLAREVYDQILAGKIKNRYLKVLYDVAHNIGKIEQYNISKMNPEKNNPRKNLVEVLVHRKGATRAFGPGRPEIPAEFRKVGQPVIIPGSMGTASYVLAGTQKAMEQSFGSTCHGAGRMMSRGEAKRKVWGENLVKELAEKNIIVKGGSMSGLAEEAPLAYKDIDEVVDVVERAGISKKVARLVPLGVIKG